MAAADDTEGAEGGSEFEVVVSERSLFDGQGSPESLFGRCQVVLCVEGGEAAERDGDLVVVGAEGALEDGEGGLKERARFAVAVEVGEDRGECGAVGGGVRVVGPEGGVADLDGAAGGRLSVGGAPGGVGEAADVVQHGGDLGIVESEARGQHLARSGVQLRGFVEAAGVLQQHGQVVADPGRAQVVGRQVTLGDGERPPVERFGAGGVAGAAAAAGQSLQRRDATNGFHPSNPSVVEQQDLVVVDA